MQAGIAGRELAVHQQVEDLSAVEMGGGRFTVKLDPEGSGFLPELFGFRHDKHLCQRQPWRRPKVPTFLLINPESRVGIGVRARGALETHCPGLCREAGAQGGSQVGGGV
jgi:hypothetical protein